MNSPIIYMITSLDLFFNREQGVFKDLEDAVEYANVNRIQHNVFQFVLSKGVYAGFIIIFGFSDYQQYMHFCNKMQVMPVDLKTFFG